MDATRASVDALLDDAQGDDAQGDEPAEAGSRGDPPSGSLHRRVQHDILTGELPPGAHLAENVLARAYGVSRTPIREVLRQLAYDGLVQRDQGRFHVRVYSREQLDELYELRSILEGAAARLAARRRLGSDLVALSERHRAMLAYTGGDALSRARLNRAFHHVVWRASRNEALVETLRRNYLHVIRHTTLMTPGRWERCIAEHAGILEALVEERPGDAEEAMIAHLAEGHRLSREQHVDRAPASA